MPIDLPTEGPTSRPIEISRKTEVDSLEMSTTPLPPRHKTLLKSYEKPRIRHVTGSWQSVADVFLHVYLYSAWYDDRAELVQPCVRVIAVRKTATYDISCVFWYNDGQPPETVLADILKIGQLYRRFEIPYDQIIITCNLPRKDQLTVPHSVSIVTPQMMKANTLLRVQKPDKSFKNRLDVGVCVSISYWNINMIRFIEWMEMLKVLGVSEVTMYDGGIYKKSKTILDYYIKQKQLNVHRMDQPLNVPGEESILLGMSASLNDCMYRNMWRYRRLICIDFDEIIIPKMYPVYSELIAAVDRHFRKTTGGKAIASFTFRNAYFFLDVKNTSAPSFSIENLDLVGQHLSNQTIENLKRNESAIESHTNKSAYHVQPYNLRSRVISTANMFTKSETKHESSNLVNYPQDVFLVTQTYTHLHDKSNNGYSSKSIINPRNCIGLQNHSCWKGLTNETTNLVFVPDEFGRNHHYKLCHFDKYLNIPGLCQRIIENYEIDKSTLKYGNELRINMRKVLGNL